jgi:hypothetical protein
MDKQISKIIYEELSYIYCDNCRHVYAYKNEEIDPCEECHRKYMQWEISESFCNAIAERITASINNG